MTNKTEKQNDYKNDQQTIRLSPQKENKKHTQHQKILISSHFASPESEAQKQFQGSTCIAQAAILVEGQTEENPKASAVRPMAVNM